VAFDRTFEEHLLERYRINLGLVLLAALVVCSILGYQIARAASTTFVKNRHHGPGDSLVEPSRANRDRRASRGNTRAGRDLQQTCSIGWRSPSRQLAQFSADIAHELRTPVHNLRGEAEVALQSFRTVEEYRE